MTVTESMPYESFTSEIMMMDPVVQMTLNEFERLCREDSNVPLHVEGIEYEIAMAWWRGRTAIYGDVNNVPEDLQMLLWAQATRYAKAIRIRG